MKRTEVKSVDDTHAIDSGRIATDKEFAVRNLLKHEPIRHKLGANGQYEVRTTTEINGRILRASCLVYRNGFEFEEFLPECTDYSRQIRHLKKIPEALKREFAGEAVAAHFNRCIAVIDYIASQDRRSRLRLNLIIFGSLPVILLLLALTGYRYLSADGKNPIAEPDITMPGNIELENFSYKCTPANACNFSLPRMQRWFETYEMKLNVDGGGKLPDWLTFDPYRLCFNGIVPADEPNRTYAVRIRMVDRDANKRLIRVNLKIERHFSPLPISPAEDVSKGITSDAVDPEELLKKLEGKGKN